MASLCLICLNSLYSRQRFTLLYEFGAWLAVSVNDGRRVSHVGGQQRTVHGRRVICSYCFFFNTHRLRYPSFIYVLHKISANISSYRFLSSIFLPSLQGGFHIDANTVKLRLKYTECLSENYWIIINVS